MVNNRLRYVIKNDKDDLKLLVRSYEEYDHLPYREMELDVLGKLPEFTCITKKENVPEAVAENIENPDGFEITREERK